MTRGRHYYLDMLRTCQTAAQAAQAECESLDNDSNATLGDVAVAAANRAEAFRRLNAASDAFDRANAEARS